jgi:signal transduction histidine kinase
VMAGRTYGADVHVQAGDLPGLDPQRETVIYRVAQEAIGNALRHSGGRTVTVTLAGRQGRVVLEVRDDGNGFDVSTTQSGLGLASMRERAASAGGRLTVTSAPGTGTVVRLSVPTNGVLRPPSMPRKTPAARAGRKTPSNEGSR